MKNDPRVTVELLTALTHRLRRTDELLRHRVSRNVNQEEEAQLTFADRLADKIAEFGGSWKFIISTIALFIVWIVVNTFLLTRKPFDPFPFVLLTFADRLADKIAEFGGSWKFIISTIALFIVWIVVNTFLLTRKPFDPFPFVLLTFADRLADKIAEFGGSWKFIISTIALFIVWIVVNTFLLTRKPFDPFPFVLLTFADRLADKIAEFGGSWKFIISTIALFIVWIVVNTFLLTRKPFDPFPFVLLTFADRLADKIAEFGGSWKFIISTIALFIVWIVVNTFLLTRKPFDPFPFVLLTFADRLADKIAEFGGSWKFIISTIALFIVWIVVNTFLLTRKPFDPFPFVLLTFADRLADKIAEFGGSWKFIISTIALFIVWIVVNTFLLTRKPFDPFPFVLLNLALNVIAALQAPIIMMSQNRQSHKDRLRANLDYQVNLKNELLLSDIIRRLDELRKRSRD